MRRLLLILAIIIVVLSLGQQYRFLPNTTFLNKYFQLPQLPGTSSLPQLPQAGKNTTVVYEESVITKVVADSLPSVVTIGIKKSTASSNSFPFDPLNPFAPFQQMPRQRQPVNQNIGSGFIITSDGLVITNKHVVQDTEATYQVLTNDKKEYNVDKIYRDPLNDMAILKINANGLKPLSLGDSTNLKLGQLVIAIGTPLGEFTNTVTHGIISGLGRGITAGSPFEGSVEKLDNVIQTDAPISPGNSGGPLLNSAGQVIGVNTAIAQEGQNIGFAIPVSVVKDLINSFNARGGSFERPYIGVRYKMVDKQTAILNSVVEGAYITEVIDGSPAAKAGLQAEDIITTVDGNKVQGNNDQSLLQIISAKKVGDSVSITYWRDGSTKTVSMILEAAK